MKLQLLKPAKSLNKAYFKQSLKREQIELFKSELQKTFTNDSNTLNKEFYNELLYIIGLEEKSGAKKIIDRNT